VQLQCINSKKEASWLQSVKDLCSALFSLSKFCKLTNIKRKESKGKEGGHEEEEEGNKTTYQWLMINHMAICHLASLRQKGNIEKSTATMSKPMKCIGLCLSLHF